MFPIDGHCQPPTLVKGDISLRAWQPTDAASVVEACQDPAIQHWLPIPVPYLLEHALNFVGEFADREWSSGDGAAFAAVQVDTGRLLGSFSLKNIHWAERTAELGYWVTSSARGQRVAQRGVRILAAWARGHLGLQRLHFLIEPSNTASCAVIERIGAVMEEVVPEMYVIQGRPRDVARYTLVLSQRW